MEAVARGDELHNQKGILEMKEKYTITKQESASIRSLQSKGYAVIVWNPDELDGVDSTDMEDHSISKGWEYIGMFGRGTEQ